MNKRTARILSGALGLMACTSAWSAEENVEQTTVSQTPTVAVPTVSVGEQAAPKELIAKQFGQMLFLDLARYSTQLGLDEELVRKGFVDAMESGMTEETAGFDRQGLHKNLNDLAQAAQAIEQAKADKEKAEKSAGNKEVIEAFLARIAAGAEGISKTETGISYEVVTAGTGEKPSSAQVTVKVHYEGSLEDGSIFDSSFLRGQPIEFPLTQVIPGWTEGVQLMETGSTYRFHIPWNLAYGEQGRPPSIPQKANLIFLVELIAIK